MWHLKTKVGVFWVTPIPENDVNSYKKKKNSKYFLGINDQELGIYTDAEEAARDVHEQRTGFYKWDCSSRINAPEHINEWVLGEPNDWK